MKTLISALALTLTAPVFAAPMYLPVESATMVTKAMGPSPSYKVSVRLSDDLKHISEATLFLGDETIEFPADALSGIEFPDLSSMRIETEKGRDNRIWVSIVFRPLRHTEFPTRFSVSVIDGTFAQVTKTWDERKGTSIHRHSEILHKEE